jgi:hypothetical protein
LCNGSHLERKGVTAMALSEQEKENILLTAKEDARALLKEVLEGHIQACPVGIELHNVVARWTGAVSVLGIIVSVISVASLIVGIIVGVKEFHSH